MAIKEVNEIPKAVRIQKAQPFEYTEKLMADITEAYNNHIEMFEFVDYDNPAYVVSHAKDVAHRFIRKTLYSKTRNEILKKLKRKFKKTLGDATEYIKVRLPYSAEPAIMVYGVTVNGQKRAYAKIDYEYIENFQEIMTKTLLEYYGKEEVQQQLLDRAEREKFNARLHPKR